MEQNAISLFHHLTHLFMSNVSNV